MTTFLELTAELAREPAAKAAYEADPEAFLADRGWAELDPSDLAEALSHAVEALPASTAASLPSSSALASGEVPPTDGLARVAQASPPEDGAEPIPLTVDGLPDHAGDPPAPDRVEPADHGTGEDAPAEAEVEAEVAPAEAADDATSGQDAPDEADAFDLVGTQPEGPSAGLDPDDGLGPWDDALEQPEGLGDLADGDAGGAGLDPQPEDTGELDLG